MPRSEITTTLDSPLADNETDDGPADSTQDQDWSKGVSDDCIGQAQQNAKDKTLRP